MSKDSRTTIIDSGLWVEPWFVALTNKEKLLYINLFSNFRCNAAGMYETSIDMMSFETKITEGDVEKTLKKLYPKVMWDGTVIWIVDHTLIQFSGRGRCHDNVVKNIALTLDALPDHQIFKQPYAEKYGHILERVVTPEWLAKMKQPPPPEEVDAMEAIKDEKEGKRLYFKSKNLRIKYSEHGTLQMEFPDRDVDRVYEEIAYKANKVIDKPYPYCRAVLLGKKIDEEVVPVRN